MLAVAGWTREAHFCRENNGIMMKKTKQKLPTSSLLARSYAPPKSDWCFVFFRQILNAVTSTWVTCNLAEVSQWASGMKEWCHHQQMACVNTHAGEWRDTMLTCFVLTSRMKHNSQIVLHKLGITSKNITHQTLSYNTIPDLSKSHTGNYLMIN